MSSRPVDVELAIREETSAVMLTNRQLQMIANTSFVPAAFRGKVPEILACVATGRALGLPDMTSLRGINVIDGKATLSAELMVAIVRSHGHSLTGEVDDEKAIAHGRRKDNGDTMTASFTMEMARRVQVLKKGGGSYPLADKHTWKSYPEAMMWARAVSQLCRMLFADCFAGATYVPEEAEETADEVIDEPWSDQVDIAIPDTDIELGLQDAPTPHQSGPPAEPSSASDAAVDAEPAGDSQQAGADASPEATVSAPAAGLSSLLPPGVQAQLAGDHVIPKGKYEGKTIREIHAADDLRWFRAMLAAKDSPTRREVEVYVRANLPELLT